MRHADLVTYEVIQIELRAIKDGLSRVAEDSNQIILATRIGYLNQGTSPACAAIISQCDSPCSEYRRNQRQQRPGWCRTIGMHESEISGKHWPKFRNGIPINFET